MKLRLPTRQGGLLHRGLRDTIALLACSGLTAHAEVAGDFNKDGRPTIADFFELQQNFGEDILDGRDDPEDPPLLGDDNDDGQVSFADFQGLQAAFNVPCPPPILEDFIVNPRPDPGDLARIQGQDLPDNADDICTLMRLPNGRFIGVEAQAAGNGNIFAEIPFIPEQLGGAQGQFMVGLGDGRRVILPEIPGLKIKWGQWVWAAFPALAVPPVGVIDDFILPPHVPCPFGGFHSTPPVEGELCVVIDQAWGAGTRVCIEARVAPASSPQLDTRIDDVEFLGEGSAVDCAILICNVIQEAFLAHPTRPLALNCDVEDLGEGEAKITLSMVNGEPIVGGNIDIKIKRPPPILDFDAPNEPLLPGDILEIAGANLPEGPDDICVLLQNEKGAMIPMDAVLAHNDGALLQALIPAVDEAQAADGPWNVIVGRGIGIRPKIRPTLPILPQFDANPWLWAGNEANMVVGPQILVAPGPLPPPFTKCFRSGPPVDGALVLCLDEDWGINSRICLSARIHKFCDNGHDVNFPAISFPGGGSKLACAAKICEVLKRAFRNRGRRVLCSIIDQGDQVKIVLRCASGRPITAGHITVKLKRPPIIIDAVDIPVAEPGGDVLVKAQNFPELADDICMVLQADDGQQIPVEVQQVDVENGQIMGQLGFIPADADGKAFRLKLGAGLGLRPPLAPIPNVAVVANPWIWVGEPADMAGWPDEIIPVPLPPPNPCFTSTPPADGKICLIIDASWGENAFVRISARIHKPCDRGHDINFSRCELVGEGTPFDCAVRICDALKAAFAARGRPVLCNVTADPNNPENAKITLQCRGPERLNGGYIKVEILNPDAALTIGSPRTPAEFSVGPRRGRVGDRR